MPGGWIGGRANWVNGVDAWVGEWIDRHILYFEHYGNYRSFFSNVDIFLS